MGVGVGMAAGLEGWMSGCDRGGITRGRLMAPRPVATGRRARPSWMKETIAGPTGLYGEALLRSAIPQPV